MTLNPGSTLGQRASSKVQSAAMQHNPWLHNSKLIKSASQLIKAGLRCMAVEVLC